MATGWKLRFARSSPLPFRPVEAHLSRRLARGFRVNFIQRYSGVCFPRGARERNISSMSCAWPVLKAALIPK